LELDSKRPRLNTTSISLFWYEMSAQTARTQVEALLAQHSKYIDDAIEEHNYWMWNDIYDEFITKLLQIQPTVLTTDCNDAIAKLFEYFDEYGISGEEVLRDRNELIRRDMERQHEFDDGYYQTNFADDINVDIHFVNPTNVDIPLRNPTNEAT
jgi:hypothetical protein